MADIILSNICKRFGEKTLFENFSLKIERGEFLSIMGESGAGKTTLLNMMGLLDRPDSGTVVLCGQKNPAFSSRTAVNLRRRIVVRSLHQAPDGVPRWLHRNFRCHEPLLTWNFANPL